MSLHLSFIVPGCLAHVLASRNFFTTTSCRRGGVFRGYYLPVLFSREKYKCILVTPQEMEDSGAGIEQTEEQLSALRGKHSTQGK